MNQSHGDPPIRRARTSETAVVADILSRAFANDPFFAWLVGRDPGAMDRRRNLFRAFTSILGFDQGEVWIDKHKRGAAIWFLPDRWRVGLVRQLRLLPAFTQATGVGRCWKKFTGLNALERHHPRRPHFYLMNLGVVPEQQGRGCGSALLRVLTERCDQSSTPAYLETAKAANVTIYQRFGFSVVDEFVLPSAGPTIWTMWREVDRPE